MGLLRRWVCGLKVGRLEGTRHRHSPTYESFPVHTTLRARRRLLRAGVDLSHVMSLAFGVAVRCCSYCCWDSVFAAAAVVALAAMTHHNIHTTHKRKGASARAHQPLAQVSNHACVGFGRWRRRRRRSCGSERRSRRALPRKLRKRGSL